MRTKNEVTTAMSGHNNDSNMDTKFMNTRKGSLGMVMKLLGAAFLILQSSLFVSARPQYP